MKEEVIKIFKIIVIVFSFISALRFLLVCINAFVYSPNILSNTNYLEAIVPSFLSFPYTHPFTIPFFIYLVTGISFLILGISLIKKNRLGIIQGIIGFALLIWIHTSFSTPKKILFMSSPKYMLFLKYYLPLFSWVMFYVISIIFLIYLFRRKK